MQIDLHFGDCVAWLKSLPDRYADMVFMDPPYGHNNNNNGDLIQRWEAALGRGPMQAARKIENDGREATPLLAEVLKELVRVLKPGACCCCCCCGGGGPDPQFARWSLLIDSLFDFKQMVIWDKGKMGMGWHYRRSYETVLVAHRKGGKPFWFDDGHKVENVIRPGDYGIKKIIPRKAQHPTEKPVALAAHFIRLHTQPGMTVIDPFLGSGSTGEAAIKLGRNFAGAELDEQFFKQAGSRLNSLTGELLAAV